MSLRLVSCIVVGALMATTVEGVELDFNRDVRPILSDNCFKCHGPDHGAREAELRLDLPDGLFGDRGGYAPFVAGRPSESEALERIRSDDPDLRMPPAESNKSLSAREIEILETWVSQGAPWEPHWAFLAPRRPDVPELSSSGWPRNPLDCFVYSRMAAEGMTPASSAAPYLLVRRVHLDLTGLPPTPEQADYWVARLTGASTGAETVDDRVWCELVDSLLASPQYGERWARRWLDLARYADTNGYEKDRERSIWPYRDWVIDALNRDLPFDRFTIEQLAGDLLPEATDAQRVATGFHRNTMLNEEGGIDPLEFRFHATTDRVATTGTTWLGLTIGCAQCHTHKYDPITHQEYYQFFAFLNNADEPELELADPQRLAEYERNAAEADRLLTELESHWPREEGRTGPSGGEVDAAFTRWFDQMRGKAVAWTPLRPRNARANLPLLSIQSDHSIYASGDTTKHDTYHVEYDLGRVGHAIRALRLEALPDPRLPAHGPGMTFYEGTKGDFFLSELELSIEGSRLQATQATESYAKNRFGAHPVSAALAVDGDFQTGWSVHDRQGERHVAVFHLERPLAPTGVLRVALHFGRHYASSLGRFRISATSASGAQALDIPEDIEHLLGASPDSLATDERTRLRHYFLLTVPELAEQAARIRELRRRPDLTTTLVMRERPAENPRPTFVHHRGEFLQPTTAVEPGVPEALHDFPTHRTRDRLGFAEWLVSAENPLTARVAVNRAWAAFFGKGLVPTLDDFGFQGAASTHPALLDWLAVEFVEQGWSLKRLHRLIVTSATYRQSSQVPAASLEQDPRNVFLARAPRFRLEAEIIRDAALHEAGLLSLVMGGAPVRPPQPPGVTEAAYGRPEWQTSSGEDRYRRSIYTFIKRTAPFAMYNTFDAPSGEACVAQRDSSNTALQALTLLNDVMFRDAARALGAELAGLPSSDEERLRAAFRRVLTRPPSSQEVAALRSFLDRQRERIADGSLAVAELVAEEFAEEASEDRQEAAVWTALARALFSLDEAITRN